MKNGFMTHAIKGNHTKEEIKKANRWANVIAGFVIAVILTSMILAVTGVLVF